ncbi:hypothetical protein Fmac_001729 [Flemingia macrophylla]|uniref:Amine oxidase domain-containing protein n=1 Tax=Flemingia macrophylla TaxID=520843 RepID=A0ABD1NHY4_9FABA
MKVAVVGGGICGLASAHALAISGVNVVLYEKEDRLGGHAKTVNVDGVDIDLGFFIFNGVTYPNIVELFKNLAFDMKLSEMSFSVSLDKGHGCEWGTRNGFSSLFAQKKNLLSPYFWQMLREIVKFKDNVNSYLDEVENNPNIARNESLGEFIISRGYSELFLKAYLIPICSSIYSYSSGRIMDFSAFSVLSYCRNHHLLEILERPQFLTGRWGSNNFVKKVKEELQRECCQIQTDMEVHLVSTSEKGMCCVCKDCSQELYDGCIMAVDAPDALRLLGDEATYDEQRILGAFQYSNSDIFLHRDKSLMPQNLATWSAWNFLGSNNKICVTYWLNILQNIEKTSQPFFVTPNPYHIPEKILFKWSTSHPIPSVVVIQSFIRARSYSREKKNMVFWGLSRYNSCLL